MFNRREFLTRSVSTAAVATVGIGTAVASTISQAASPDAREGLGALVIDGELVVFDAIDFKLEPGALAVVIQPAEHGFGGPVVRRIGDTPASKFYGPRTGTLEAEMVNDAMETIPIVCVLGRVIERRPQLVEGM